MLKILGIGNALVDVLVFIPDDLILTRHGLHKGGMTLIDEKTESTLEQEMLPLKPHMTTGGSAGNTMLALAGLGAAPAYIGRVGNDKLGDFFRETGAAMGINEKLIVCDEHTGVANTFISPDGERSFGTYLGAAMGLKADDITEAQLEGCDIVHIEGYLVQNHNLIEKICQTAKKLNLQLSLDLGSWNIINENRVFFHHLVKDYIDIVFANEEEACAFTGIADAKHSLPMIASMTNTAIVKLGRRGASAMNRHGERIAVPACNPGKPVDTTAAGDFFSAGFLHAYSQGASLETCLKLGSKLSEKVIQIIGTRLSESTWNEIRKYANELLTVTP